MKNKNTPTHKQGQSKSNHIIRKNSIKCNFNNISQAFSIIRNQKKFIHYSSLKCPISPLNNHRIGIDNKKHFVGLKEALTGLEKSKKAVGIGLILGKTNFGNICCIDIDECMDKNGNYYDEVKKILEIFKGCYIEISQSGNGLHIIFWGTKKPNWICRISNLSFCKSLEIYDKKRFISLTGNLMFKNGSLINKQKELENFYNTYFKANIEAKTIKTKPLVSNNFESGLKKDKKFLNLWQGKRYFNDESRNDLALMSKILYWCGYDINYAVKAFKKSPFASQKDNFHKIKLQRADYLIRTAEKCCQEVQNG